MKAMKPMEIPVRRRALLSGVGASALAWLGRPMVRSAAPQQGPAVIAAERVAELPTEPDDSLWNESEPTTVPLNPQNLVLPRLMEAGAKEVEVRALYDAERVAFLVEWPDAHDDTDLGTVLEYRDAAAIQFPEDPFGPTPSFMMGQPDSGVTIYHWKSDWQFGPLYDVEEAYPNMYADLYQLSGVPVGAIPEATDYLTEGRPEYLTAAAVGNSLADPRAQESIGPVQRMRADGFGTIEPDEIQDGGGTGMWRDGAWKIVFSVPLEQPAFTFREGAEFPVGFAIWDGSRRERNGQKAYSVWNTLRLGTAPAAPPEALPSLGRVGAVLAAILAPILGIRLWAARRRDEEESTED
ncbi:MAG: ethylbenzene dehydrogenase-related protein [Anaerolineae bacterium]